MSGQTKGVDEVKWHRTEALCKYIHNQSCTNNLYFFVRIKKIERIDI
jgi:hypothetical protein